jgi:protocatechuate 3,4-dioxygenase beta subunit
VKHYLDSLLVGWFQLHVLLHAASIATRDAIAYSLWCNSTFQVLLAEHSTRPPTYLVATNTSQNMVSDLILIAFAALAGAHAPSILTSKQLSNLHDARSICSRGIHCILAKEAMEGPYYVAHPLLRPNITEDRQGILLDLTVSVIDVRNCTPVEGVYVDIWHADGMGEYSGWASTHLHASSHPMEVLGTPVEESRWLRGVVPTDQKGIAKFNTIMPGWYPGRATHIHIRIHAGNVRTKHGYLLSGGNTAHTGQLFFSDELVNKVSKTREPYMTHRKVLKPTMNGDDGLYLHSDGGEQTVSIEEQGRDFIGTITVGVDPSADHLDTGPHELPSHLTWFELICILVAVLIFLPMLWIAGRYIWLHGRRGYAAVPQRDDNGLTTYGTIS